MVWKRNFPNNFDLSSKLMIRKTQAFAESAPTSAPHICSQNVPPEMWILVFRALGKEDHIYIPKK